MVLAWKKVDFGSKKRSWVRKTTAWGLKYRLSNLKNGFGIGFIITNRFSALHFRIEKPSILIEFGKKKKQVLVYEKNVFFQSLADFPTPNQVFSEP